MQGPVFDGHSVKMCKDSLGDRLHVGGLGDDLSQAM